MYRAGFELNALEWVPAEAEANVVLTLAQALMAIDCVWLRYHPETPLLYASGVRYRKQPVGADRWLDIPRILEGGFGSCTDLAPWRAAELTILGEPASLGIKTAAVPDPDGKIFMAHHVVVVRASGAEEDPSQALGMNALSPELCLGGRCIYTSAGQSHAMHTAGCFPCGEANRCAAGARR